MDVRFTKDVRKEQRGLRWKGTILHLVFMLKVQLILFVNYNNVGCTTPTPSMDFSSFTTSEESRMGKHKTISYEGTLEYEDGGHRTKCI